MINFANFTDLKKEISSILGKPYFQTDNCILFNGNSTDLLKKLSSPFLNSIITSPPYNIGKEYEKVKPIDEYINWSSAWLASSENLLLPNGSLLLNIGYVKIENKARAIPLPYLLWDKINMFLNQEIIWNYSAGVACKNYLSPRNEKILWYVKDEKNYTFNLDPIRDKNVKYPNSKRNGKLRVNTLGKNPSDVWEIAKVTTGTNRSSSERTSHPTQFPTDLVDRLVLGFTNERDIILDPFMGSGTTFISSIKYNRFCIGFEISKNYCEIAKNRILKFEKEINNSQLTLEIG